MKKSINFLILFLYLITARAQEIPYPASEYADTIWQWQALIPVFQVIEQNPSSGVNIFHAGDSHLQADIFSGSTRNRLQEKFGNAGRGLVFPFKLAKTNGPRDYGFTSMQNWNAVKIVKSTQTAYCGLSGWGLSTNHTYANMDYVQKVGTATPLQSVRVFYAFNEKVPVFSLQTPDYNTLQQKNSSYYSSWGIDSFFLSQQVNGFSLRMQQDKAASATLDGIVLNTNTPGICYMSTGVNGATYENYLHAPRFFEQLKALKPTLTILSLGSNESAAKYDSLEFILWVDSVVQNIQATGSTVLITTPADNYRPHTVYTYKKVKGKKRRVKTRVYTVNEKALLIRENLLAYCKNKNIACWDLYGVFGGYGSMQDWVNMGWAAKDHMHFTGLAYTLQGELLAKALIKAWQNYLEK